MLFDKKQGHAQYARRRLLMHRNGINVVLFWEGSERVTNIISVPVYNWKAIGELSMITNWPCRPGAEGVETEGKKREWAPGLHGGKTNQPCHLSAPSDILGWPQRRHNVSQSSHNLHKAKGMKGLGNNSRNNTWHLRDASHFPRRLLLKFCTKFKILVRNNYAHLTFQLGKWHKVSKFN